MERSKSSLVPFLSDRKRNPEQPITKLFFCKNGSIFVSKIALVAIGLRLFLKPRLEEKLVLTAKRGKMEIKYCFFFYSEKIRNLKSLFLFLFSQL